jgi:hypothetical protein
MRNIDFRLGGGCTFLYRLYVAYGFSADLTHFRSEHWRKIRASRGFERDLQQISVGLGSC